MKYNMLP